MRLVSRALLITLPVTAGLGLAGLAMGGPAAAQEDSMAQQWEDLKTAAGFGPDHPPIDFSERPPLAVPPSNTLPPPGSGPEANLGVNDPDFIARRKALSDPRRPVPPTDPGAAAAGLSARTYLIDPPSGMRDPAAVAAGRETDTGGAVDKPARRHHSRKSASNSKSASQ